MRVLSPILSVLVALALALPFLPAGPELGPDPWMLAGRDLGLLVLPIFLVYLGSKAHLRRDHADGAWASEVGALAWVLSAPRPTASTTGAALLFGAHLLLILGHRRSRPIYLTGAGATLCAALVAEPYLAPAAAGVALHGLFGGYRHLPRPRFDALSGRMVAGFGGFILAGLLAGVLVEAPLLPPPPEARLEPLRLLGATIARGGLLPSAPWVLLAPAGLFLWWRRGTRRGFFWVTGAVLLLLTLTATLPGAPERPALLLLSGLPFLAGPTARFLSHLRERPGLRGPRLAGLGLGLVVAGVVPVSPRPTDLAAAGAVGLLGLLLPGRASARGRLEAFLFAAIVAASVAGALHFL